LQLEISERCSLLFKVQTNNSPVFLPFFLFHLFVYIIMAPLDLDTCLERLYKKQLLAECVIKEICERTKELLMSESNVVHIRAPVTVVGDIHG
jgi:hypothetical protein